MAVESFMGIELFKNDGWDEMDLGELCFYGVEFLIPSMKKFNGPEIQVIMSINGDFHVEVISEEEDENGFRNATEVLFKDNIAIIPEVYEAITKRYNEHWGEE